MVNFDKNVSILSIVIICYKLRRFKAFISLAKYDNLF